MARCTGRFILWLIDKWERVKMRHCRRLRRRKQKGGFINLIKKADPRTIIKIKQKGK